MACSEGMGGGGVKGNGIPGGDAILGLCLLTAGATIFDSVSNSKPNDPPHTPIPPPASQGADKPATTGMPMPDPDDEELKQYQKKYKHAGDFGITENYNNENLRRFYDAIQEHKSAAGTQQIVGTYRGQAASIYVNPETGLAVITKPDGTFISGWRLNAQQLANVLTRGSL